ncbi:hypothetical protein Nepgr_001502 [Nepenthes gracilis]|uniref:Uncharacterized protein n=1 Tax=Nepenthes gracilis TaxID=150966 RepID=A0AAD3P791_NEPGR|nr:hypothetical protein Nepgr_001502 [Nepenthes gracilis]
MARISRAQELAALKSDNENLRTLNARLLRDSVEKKREIANLLESKKSLEGELVHSREEMAAYVAELEAMRLAFRDGAAKMHEMKVVLEALHRSAAEAHRRTLWTLAFSGAAIFATAAASVVYFSR